MQDLRLQLTAYRTLVRKETIRFLRIWVQTLLPPVITQSLYFVIFGKFIGSRIGEIQGVSYMAFIVPGLVMMAVINSSFSNVVSSFFGAKFQRSVEELLVSPTENITIMAGYVTGGVMRGLMVGGLVFAVSVFFARPAIYHVGCVFLFISLTAVVFALAGFTVAIFARKFDDISLFPTFILIPLTYLGGVFYSIQSLPPFWQGVSRLNPVLYMVNGFRFGFHGVSDVRLMASFAILLAFAGILISINLWLLRQGTGLRS